MKINCFVIIPFSKEFDPVWVSIQDCLDKLNNQGLTIVTTRASEETKAETIHQNIFSHINESDLVIVDVSEENRNVIFEFGYSVAKNKYIIPISQTGIKELSTDYRPYVFIEYEKKDLDFLKSRLRTRVREQIERIKLDESAKTLEEKVISDKDEIQIRCFKNRKVAKLNDVFESAKNEIKILTTNLNTIAKEYSDSIKKALQKNNNLNVQFLTLDPESYFVTGRSQQLGRNTSEFRTELNKGLFEIFRIFGQFPNVEIRTYDDFPTQITFQIDDTTYNCVVNKYQPSRDNCIFELNSKYPSLFTSFNLHFISVWRDPSTTKVYFPDKSSAQLKEKLESGE